MIFRLIGDYHHIIGHLIIYNEFTIPVIDKATRGILHTFKECVGIGCPTIVLTHYLQGEKTYGIDNDNQY